MIKIIDFVLVAIILICGWCGYKKGLIMGIGGIIAIILSLLAANLLAKSFSYELVPVPCGKDRFVVFHCGNQLVGDMPRGPFNREEESLNLVSAEIVPVAVCHIHFKSSFR